MTIKKLKELIADLPDDMRVYADDGRFSMFENPSEFICLVTNNRDDKCILQSEADIEVEDVLSELAELAFDYGWSDDDFYREALERGFTADDFPDPEKAKQDMENYGLI